MKNVQNTIQGIFLLFYNYHKLNNSFNIWLWYSIKDNETYKLINISINAIQDHWTWNPLNFKNLILIILNLKKLKLEKLLTRSRYKMEGKKHIVKNSKME